MESTVAANAPGVRRPVASWSKCRMGFSMPACSSFLTSARSVSLALGSPKHANSDSAVALPADTSPFKVLQNILYNITIFG